MDALSAAPAAARSSPWRTPAACRAAHAALLRARIAALAPVLALLTLAWVPLDLAWLGWQWQGAMATAVVRLALAAALMLLAGRVARLRVGVAVTAFVWLQALGFALLQLLVAHAPPGAAQIGYGLFPFVLAAQLAVLPLPWLRALLCASAPAALLLGAAWLGDATTSWRDAWLFVLIASVAIWTSDAQLRLLVDLLGARTDASHDPLTGLANRRAAIARLELECGRALRGGGAPAVLMLDLDHFKQVNDRHGHALGDAVLVALADVLRAELRGVDLGARHGGEEFLALLPDTEPAQALAVAERIRARVAVMAVAGADGPVRVTVSIGVAGWAGDTPDGLLARADAALYAAKSAGRDRCRLAPAAPAAALATAGA